MSIVLSAAITALVLSPVFVLAGWIKGPQVQTARSQFNRAHGKRF